MESIILQDPLECNPFPCGFLEAFAPLMRTPILPRNNPNPRVSLSGNKGTDASEVRYERRRVCPFLAKQPLTYALLGTAGSQGVDPESGQLTRGFGNKRGA